MCDQRTREPATSEQRLGQWSLSALRAILAGLSNLHFLRLLLLHSFLFLNLLFHADLFAPLLHP
jgi:hypothetical protein